jgi:HSP20 family molecular chaperone IbpA
MSSQTAPARSKEPPAAVSINSSKDLQERAQARIASRAYELYEQDGRNHGEDMSHWLRAESEILKRVPEIHESSSWFTINVPLKGFAAGEIRVNIEPRYALIAAERQPSSGTDEDSGVDSLEQSSFAVAKWPSEVDPSTASAYVKDGILTLAVKRALPPAGSPASGNLESNR